MSNDEEIDYGDFGYEDDPQYRTPAELRKIQADIPIVLGGKKEKKEKQNQTKEKREPKKTGIDYVPTHEVNISKKYKDGVFQNKYLVSITLSRVPKTSEVGVIYSHKETIKKTFASMEEAIAWRDQIKGTKANYKKAGKKMTNHRWTIDEAIEEYETSLLADGFSEDYISDKKRYGRHALTFFNKANNDLDKVAAIEVGNVKDYLAFLYEQHHYSQKTLEKERAYIHTLWDYMLQYPKRFGVSVNVASGAKIPAMAGSTYKSRILKYWEIEEIIKEACQFDDPSFLFLVVFSITQGLRRGELCGLKWGDVHLKERRAVIQHNRIQTVATGKNRLKEPKTGKIRIIELHNVGYETICLYKKWQEDYLGRPVKDDEYVLRYEVNLKYNYEPHTGKISRKWKETWNKINKNRAKQEKAAIEYGRLHDGRHVYASLLLNGVEKEDGTKVPSASYIQVYQSMGHSLPEALRNTTTSDYTTDTGARFEVTRFWNELLSVDVKEEWELARKKEDSMTQVQKDILAERKRKRMEKANQERLAAHLPKEELVTYTEDGYEPGFEEDDL